MDLLYQEGDATPQSVNCIMILLVALVEPHYEINLWNKVYNEREIDCKCASTHGDHPACPAVCSVPSPMGTTMCVNTVREAKATEFFVV